MYPVMRFPRIKIKLPRDFSFGDIPLRANIKCISYNDEGKNRYLTHNEDVKRHVNYIMQLKTVFGRFHEMFPSRTIFRTMIIILLQ